MRGRAASFVSVKPYANLIRERLLPVEGEVLVSTGSMVEARTIVARSFLPQQGMLLPVARSLSIRDEDLPQNLVKRIGDQVSRGETLVQVGPEPKVYRSPAAGRLVAQARGRLVLADSLIPLTVLAGMPGKVVQVVPGRGAILETRGSIIEGVWGQGGEATGRLEYIPYTAGPLQPRDIRPRFEETVLAFQGWAEKEALVLARDLGIRGLVLGSILASFWPELAGLQIPILLTEGFGEKLMAQPIAKILQTVSGKDVYLAATFPRPQMIIPMERDEVPAREESIPTYLAEGSEVRLALGPKRGELGVVTDPNLRLQRLDSGIEAFSVEVLLEGGDKVVVALANLEVLL